jgi:P27 family predicted phage terminase small subunit
MRGRPPKPSVVKLVEGNPGKRPINDKEPKPPDGKPTCPAHMSKGAKSAWRKLSPVLHEAGLLTKLDGMALETLCETYSKWLDANEKLYKEGLIIKSPVKGFPMQNPLFSVVNRLFEQLNKMFNAFGMTPSERSRLHVEKSKGNTGESDPLSVFASKPRR